MKHGSLFSGIGGFDLAAEWMGWENVFHCEWNPFGQRVLKHYWPEAISYDDITKTDFTIHRGAIDILTGGFPCQPYSLAGKRKGKEDERHLWPEMLRAIREIQPRWVVGENVFGLINWNRGMVFDQVQADLEDSGYHVWTYVLPAASVNAPHRRDRVWFVAYANNTGRDSGCGEIQKTDGEISQWDNNAEFSYANNGLASYASSQRHTRGPNSDWKQEDQAEWSNLRYMFAGPGEEWLTSYTDSRRQSGQEYRQKEPGRVAKTIVPDDWSNFPTQSPVCSGNNGFSSRLDGITFPKWRNESIKAAGNAIVPQVVYQIFKAIEQYEKEVA